MKIILTEDQYEQLTEMIKLDIKVGDTIMGGKFKNKKVDIILM
jgi:co-chaperonin GroES (HSP10)